VKMFVFVHILIISDYRILYDTFASVVLCWN
jgi:hypothetical protein